jgi:hypothetical protein
MKPLPFHSTIDEYLHQADELLQGWQARDPEAVRIFGNNLPRFLDEKTPWLAKNLSEEELFGVTLYHRTRNSPSLVAIVFSTGRTSPNGLKPASNPTPKSLSSKLPWKQ